MSGWISLHRELLNKSIWKFSTPSQKTILITLLLMADHQKNEWEWKGKQFKTIPGQFVTSLDSIVKKAGKGITVKMVRVSITKFEKYDFLANESTKTGRLITITNWESYQDREKKGAKKRAKIGQSGGKGGAPNNNVNNVNNIIKRYSFPNEYSENLINTFANFILNREELKKKVTEKAFAGLVNKLKKLSDGSEQIAIEILEESTINGWSGIFPLKNTLKKEGIKHNGFTKEYYKSGEKGPKPSFDDDL